MTNPHQTTPTLAALHAFQAHMQRLVDCIEAREVVACGQYVVVTDFKAGTFVVVEEEHEADAIDGVSFRINGLGWNIDKVRMRLQGQTEEECFGR